MIGSIRKFLPDSWPLQIIMLDIHKSHSMTVQSYSGAEQELFTISSHNCGYYSIPTVM